MATSSGANQFKIAVLCRTAGPNTCPVSCGLQTFRTDKHSHIAATDQLLIPKIRLLTIGSRRFPVAGATVWNNLPADVTSAPLLLSLRQHLKPYAVNPIITLIFNFVFAFLSLVDLAVTVRYMGHVKKSDMVNW